MTGDQASVNEVVFLQDGIRESARGSAQQKEKFASPKQNVQQAAALQIVDGLIMQGHIQRPARTLLDEGPQGREVHRQTTRLLAPGIDSLQIFVAKFYEVVQAKILLSK
jgi:hypothetical protein